MKKIIFALIAVCLMVAPAYAAMQNWTINFTLSGPADHIDIKYATYSSDFTAGQFMNRSDLQAITLPATSPQSFSIEMPVGTRYAVFGEIIDDGGNKDFFMDESQGYLSPTVWRAVALDAVGDAHYQDITPVPVSGGGVVNIITINNNNGN